MIAAVAGRMHEDAALEAEKLMQTKQVLLRRVGRRKRPVRRIGKLVVRPEHVEMRVARQWRQLQIGLLRIGIRRRYRRREIVGVDGHLAVISRFAGGRSITSVRPRESEDPDKDNLPRSL